LCQKRDTTCIKRLPQRDGPTFAADLHFPEQQRPKENNAAKRSKIPSTMLFRRGFIEQETDNTGALHGSSYPSNKRPHPESSSDDATQIPTKLPTAYPDDVVSGALSDSADELLSFVNDEFMSSLVNDEFMSSLVNDEFRFGRGSWYEEGGDSDVRRSPTYDFMDWR
jgi:hypothetical protein